MKKLVLAMALIASFIKPTMAQNTRLNDFNRIGWYGYFGTFKINKNVGIHTEYQWRRDNLVKDKLQGLLRLGINYQPIARLQLRLGYAWAETYAYGDYPINGFGKDFTEHRLYQMATVNDKLSIVDLTHRFMLEQRWIGRYSNANLTTEDSYVLLNRMRYMCRLQMPLKGKTIENKTPYLAVYDEILIGFGKNVNENIFDQNRIGVLLGYKFNNLVRIEAGYLNQILQLGREINNQNVFQNNNGIVVNSIFNFDVSKKESK
jgi:opacity protein-like surface antigen